MLLSGSTCGRVSHVLELGFPRAAWQERCACGERETSAAWRVFGAAESGAQTLGLLSHSRLATVCRRAGVPTHVVLARRRNICKGSYLRWLVR